MPYLENIRERAVLGTFSITTKDVKYLDPDCLIQVYGDVADTPSAITRDYLSITYGTRMPKTHHENWNACLKIIDGFKPQLARPGVYPDCVLVDLSSAYWEIIRRVGYDVVYHPGEGLGVRSQIDTFPWRGNKLARAMLLVSAMESGLWWWDGQGRTSFERTFNPLLQPMLVALVYDVLHGVAADVRELATYWNVDGGIIRRHHLPLWEEIAAGWGLPWKIKAAGYAMVRSVGSYWIGNLRTKGGNRHNHAFDNTRERNPWLRERFLAFKDFPEQH